MRRSMAKRDDSVNRIPRADIADTRGDRMHGYVKPLRFIRCAGSRVDEMEAPAGEGCRASSFPAWLLFKMCLHILPVRGHRNSNRPSAQHDGTANFIFDLDQSWSCFSCSGLQRHLAKAKGPRGPLQNSPAAAIISIIARPIVARAVIAWCRIISGAVTVAVIDVRLPPAASPGIADRAGLLDV